MDPTPLTMTIEQAAARVPCKPDWYRKQVRDRRFPAHKVGREWRITEADLQGALEAMAVPALPAKRDPHGLTPGARRHLERTVDPLTPTTQRNVERGL